MYGLYLPGYQDVIDMPVCRIDRIQDVDQGAGATGTHRGRQVAKPARRSHTFSSHCVLSHLFCLLFRKKIPTPFSLWCRYHLWIRSFVGCCVFVNCECLYEFCCTDCQSTLFFSRVPEIRASLASNYAGICVVRTSINILPSMFLLAILRQR